MISAPTLIELAVSWQWAYQIGDARRRIPLDVADAENDYRDIDAERAVLAGLAER
ncbi:MAG TPA: hypothetical protein VJ914_34090 [Pseudonocardiaceae bacterium]|nr:hypothetical protein [Pseudonocardiaceae bacterium]